MFINSLFQTRSKLKFTAAYWNSHSIATNVNNYGQKATKLIALNPNEQQKILIKWISKKANWIYHPLAPVNNGRNYKELIIFSTRECAYILFVSYFEYAFLIIINSDKKKRGTNSNNNINVLKDKTLIKMSSKMTIVTTQTKTASIKCDVCLDRI